MVRGKYKYKSILKMFFVIILSCIMAVTMNNAAMAVVIDVSGHDGLIDWDSADVYKRQLRKMLSQRIQQRMTTITMIVK